MSTWIFRPALAMVTILTLSAVALAGEPTANSANDGAAPPSLAWLQPSSYWLETAGELAAIEATAQTPPPAATEPAPTTSAPAPTPAAETVGPFGPVIDYSGDLWHRQGITGDWNGTRTELARKGVTFEIEVFQTSLWNARGSPKTTDFQRDVAKRITRVRAEINAAILRFVAQHPGETFAHVLAQYKAAVALHPKTVDPAVRAILQRILSRIIQEENGRLIGLLGDPAAAKFNNAQANLAALKAILANKPNSIEDLIDCKNGYAYQGSASYAMMLDFEKMGLWPGGFIKIRGENKWGEDIWKDSKTFLPTNWNALLPTPEGGSEIALSEWYYMQFLSKQFGVILGKVDLTLLGDQNEFASNEKTQFMNTAFRINPVLLTLAPYTSLSAGVVAMPTDWLTVMAVAFNPEDSAQVTGFDTVFDHTGACGEVDVKVKPFGLPGTQRIGGIYSNKEFIELGSLSREIAPGDALPLTLRLKHRPDDWCLYYNFDQYVWTLPGDPKQGIGLFGRYGHSTGESNPVENFYSLGVGGKGVIPTRKHDAYGVGYYYLQASTNLPDILHMSDEQGVEAFYNIEITPWMHLSPDFQVITDPGAGFRPRNYDIVAGARLVINF
jgi:porin